MSDEHARNTAVPHGPGGGDHDEEGHEGAPEWLISFADNTALMMGFFVILFALNMAPKGSNPPDATTSDNKHTSQPSPAMMDFVIGLREGFNNPIQLDSKVPAEQPFIRRIKQLRAKDGGNINDGPQGDHKDVQSLRPTNYHAPAAKLYFDPNSATLTRDARAAIDNAADYLRGLNLIVQVRGHASAREAYLHPQQVWKLSFDRAMAVAHELAKQGVDWSRLRIVASGAEERLRDRHDQAANLDSLNRCVEVVQLDKTLAQSAPPPVAHDDSTSP